MSGEPESLEASEEIKRLILKHALLNAVKHGGKASLGPVINKILGEMPELRVRAKEIAGIAKEIVDQVNSMDPSQQQSLLEMRFAGEIEEKRPGEEYRELPPLPEAERGVVTRFAPNPDFVLHLGNARPALLSYIYAKEIYRGKMILRFEDTDPRIKTPLPEAYWAIKEDLRWLGIKWDEEYVQSMRMEIYYGVARELIKRGGAYIDLCGREEISKSRVSRKACSHRLQSVEENLELFDKMLSNFFGEGEAALRIKTDLNHPDPSVVDWIGMRIIDTSRYPHPLSGDRYIVWPTYNFAAGVDDHLMGVTHIIRGREHVQNTTKQLYLYSHMGWSYPHVVNVGRLKLEGFILSKSKIRSILSKSPGRFSGYADPRFGTLAGLRSRGILAETIREMVKGLGVKPSDASISWDNLASLNRKKLDPVARRLMMVIDPVKLYIEGLPEELLARKVPYHPDNSSLGERGLRVDVDEKGAYVYISRKDLEAIAGKTRQARLMELANIEIIGSTDAARSEPTIAIARYISADLETARKRGMPIIQWVSHKPLKALLKEPMGLSYVIHRGLIENSVAILSDEIYQLLRIGFAKIIGRRENMISLLKIHD